jgi:hypothetical protein
MLVEASELFQWLPAERPESTFAEKARAFLELLE